MNYKNSLFIVGLILLVIFSVSSISANENITSLDENNDDVIAYADYYNNYNEPEEAVIIADDFQTYYYSDEQIEVTVVDSNGNALNNVKVIAKYHTGGAFEDYTDYYGNVYFYPFYSMGTHKITFSIEDDNYIADPVKINVKITKEPVKLTVKSITTTKNKYVTLKAVVKDTCKVNASLTFGQKIIVYVLFGWIWY